MVQPVIASVLLQNAHLSALLMCSSFLDSPNSYCTSIMVLLQWNNWDKAPHLLGGLTVLTTSSETQQREASRIAAPLTRHILGPDPMGTGAGPHSLLTSFQCHSAHWQASQEVKHREIVGEATKLNPGTDSNLPRYERKDRMIVQAQWWDTECPQGSVILK